MQQSHKKLLENLCILLLFGKIKILGAIPEYDTIQIIDETKIIFKKNNTLSFFDINKQLAQEINLFEKSIDNFFYSDGILSIFTVSQINNYKIELP